MNLKNLKKFILPIIIGIIIVYLIYDFALKRSGFTGAYRSMALAYPGTDDLTTDCAELDCVLSAASSRSLSECLSHCDTCKSQVKQGGRDASYCTKYCEGGCHDKFQSESECLKNVLWFSDAEDCCHNCDGCPEKEACKRMCRKYGIQC